jgi:hypothetical protein
MTYPRLLVLKRLLEPSMRAQKTVKEIRDRLAHAPSDSIELKGLFIFLVAALETMLTDTYSYYLRSFPEAFDFKEVKFSKEEILGATLAAKLIDQQIEKNAISQAYGSFPDLLRTFTKTLSIPETSLDADLIDRIIEAKETRNILLHNGLKTNRQYVARAGRFRQSDQEDRQLGLTQDYVNAACQHVDTLIDNLRTPMHTKYQDFTRIAALRRLWNFLFSSPLMHFDDYWSLDEGKDEIRSMKEFPKERLLSSSEKTFLALWRMHFNQWKQPQDMASMYTLDSEHQQKMVWFLAMLTDFNLR